MKVSKDILFRLLLVAALLFSLGLEVYSNYYTPVSNMEVSSELNDEDNNVVSNADAYEDDPYTQHYEITYLVENVLLMTVLNDLFVLKDYPLSNWQPPKFC